MSDRTDYAGLDSLDHGGGAPLLPRFDHALFNRIADDLDPGWRVRKAKARAEADMLWHNQGLTWLSPVHRAGLAQLSDGLKTAMGDARA